MEEKRIIEQKEIYNEKGELEYTIIPNYKVKHNFITENEIKFYSGLIIAINKLRVEKNIDLQIFTQVALNQIIEINNRRNKQLYDNILGKSIDFVLYNKITKKIYCCIELDDKTHLQEDRKERDRILDKIFKDNIKLVHIKSSNFYDPNEIYEKII